MFEKFSREQSLRVTGFVTIVDVLFGVDLQSKGLDEGSLADFLVTGALVVGLVVEVVGWLIRKAKGDVNVVGVRK